MAFSDPQSVTINAVAQSLPNVARGVNEGTYQKDDGNVVLSAKHQYGKRTRRSVRLQQKKIAPDPFQSGLNNPVSASVTVVIDHPPGGFFSNTELKQLSDALLAWLTASSSANTTKILGGES